MATKKADEAKALAHLEGLSEEYNLQKFIDLGEIQRAVGVAAAIQEYRKAIEPILHRFLPLAGDSMGFRTDKDNYDQGYPPAVIKNVLAEALLRGLPLTGNNFNIISNRLYITKEGMFYSVLNYPGVTDVEIDVGQADPDNLKIINQKTKKGKDAQVWCGYLPFLASWTQNGAHKEMETAVYVRAFAGDGVMDALQGKAMRKGLAKLLQRLMGNTFVVPEGEIETEPTVQVEAELTPDEPKPKAARVKERLKKAAKPPKEDPPPKEEKAPEEASQAQDEASDATPMMDIQAIQRVQRIAKARWPETFLEQIEGWCEFNHQTKDLGKCPVYAETEVMRWIKDS